MGILSDFFVASPNELHTVLPGWLPVADKPIKREEVNPFTRKKQVFIEWPPAVDPPRDVPPESRVPDFQHVSHLAWARVDPAMLAELNVILNGGELSDKLSQFNRPALIDPIGPDESGLHRLDHDFVTALAAISEPAAIAKQWAASTEKQVKQLSKDAWTELVCDLTHLAQEAHTSGKGLYYLWGS